MGASPATQPTQNKGYEVAGQKMVGLALLILEQALPLAGAGSEPGKVIHKSIGDLSKLVPPGAVTPQDVQNVLQQLMMKQAQFSQQMNQMKQQQAQPAQAGAPQPGGAPQMARAA